MCAKIIHATSSSRGPERGHLPVEHRDRLEVRSTARCRPGSRPTRAPGRSRRRRRASCASSQSSACSTSGDRPMSGTANSYQDFSQSRLRRNALRSDPSARKPNVVSASGIECSFASTSTVLSCSFALRSAGESANQLPPKVYGITSGGTTPVDVVHQEERRAQHRRRSARASAPAAPARRSVSPTSRITSNWWSIRYDENTGTSCVGGRDAGHPLLFVLLTVARPSGRSG